MPLWLGLLVNAVWFCPTLMALGHPGPIYRNHSRGRIDKHDGDCCVINFMDTNMRHPIVSQALELLACETRETDRLASPDALRDYLRLLLGDRPHEIFAVVFLDAQHRVIATEEMFRGTLTQTRVYPREVVIEALNRNAAAVILCHNHPFHNHPTRSPQPSQANLTLTCVP